MLQLTETQKDGSGQCRALSLYMGRGKLTDNKLLLVHSLVNRMIPRQHQRALYPLACSLLGKLHLQDRLIDGLTGNLTANHVEFARRHLEASCRVFVLEDGCEMSKD